MIRITEEEIRQIPLLKAIDLEALKECFKNRQILIRHYNKGTTVHHQHESCTALDVVLSGSLVAYSLSENGSAMNLFEFHKDSIIGANLLFADHNVYPLNIYSLTPCKLLHIDKHAVMEFFHNYHFVMQYVKSLSMNSQGMNQKITIMSQKTLRENLIDYLKQQAMIQGTSKIILPISKKQLADYLGVQRPSLFRELKKLKDEKLIEVDNRLITLHLKY
ncbi:MAG: hypothetical protein ACFWUC_12970 [Oscillospiraceae bacterium]